MGSLADNEGLKIGDQILNVNGHDFSNLYHHRAIQILRGYHQYIFVLREIGLVPMYKEMKVLKKGLNGKYQNNTFDAVVYNANETRLSMKVLPSGLNQDNAKFKRKYGKLEDILWPTKQSSSDEIYDDISLASGYLNNNEELYAGNMKTTVLVNGGNNSSGTVESSPSISHDNSTLRLRSPVHQLRQNNMVVVGNALKRSVGIENDLNRLTESPLPNNVERCNASGLGYYEGSELGSVEEQSSNQVYRDSPVHKKPPRIGSEVIGKRSKDDHFRHMIKSPLTANSNKRLGNFNYDKAGKNEAMDQQKIKIMSKSPTPIGAFYTCGCSPTRIYRSAPNTGLQHFKWVSEPSLTALNNDSLLVGHASRYLPMDKSLGSKYAYDGIPRRVHAKRMLYNSRVELNGAKHLTLSCPDLGALGTCLSRGKYGPIAAKIYDRTWWLGPCNKENTARKFDKSHDVERERVELGHYKTCGLEDSSSQCRYSKRLGKVNALIQEFETKRNAQTTAEHESKEHKEMNDLKDTERASILFKKNKESLEHLKLRLDQICKERELVLNQTSEDSPKKFSGRIHNKGGKDLASPKTEEHIYENAEVIKNYFKGQREKSIVLNEEKDIKQSQKNYVYHQEGNNNLVAINLDENVVIQV